MKKNQQDDILKEVREQWQIFEIDRDKTPLIDDAKKLVKYQLGKEGFNYGHRVNYFSRWAASHPTSPFKPKDKLKNAFVEGIRRHKVRGDDYHIFILWAEDETNQT